MAAVTVNDAIKRVRSMRHTTPGPYDMHDDALACAIVLADEIERRDRAKAGLEDRARHEVEK